MSTTTSQQGDSIPGIAHAVEFEYNPDGQPPKNKKVNFGVDIKSSVKSKKKSNKKKSFTKTVKGVKDGN